MTHINHRSWAKNINNLTRALILIGVLALLILPCPGPDITRALYQLRRKLTMINSGEAVLLVPLRWCVVEGSPSVVDPGSFGFTDTDSIIFHRLLSTNNDFWTPGASIAFRSAFTSQVEDSANFPIIPDSYPPGTGVGQLGDINLDHYGFYEASITHIELAYQIADCEAAWDQLELEYETNLEGIVVLGINRFVGNTGQQSTTQGVATSSVACNPGSTLTMTVCEDLNTMSSNDGASMAVKDASYEDGFGSVGYKDVTLAHELGHTLFLGHGDGLDNDGDGLFDACCDADENESSTPYSLMSPYSSQASSGVITELQREWSKKVASKTPGVVFDPPAAYIDGSVVSDRRVDEILDIENATIDMVWAGISEDKDTEMIAISFKLLGVIDGEVNNSYLMIADLDNDPDTGSQPTDLGFSERFRGVDVVAVVTVNMRSEHDEIVVGHELWIEKNGAFEEAPSDKSFATISTIIEVESQTPLFSVVNLKFPSSLIGPIGSVVKFQAVAQDASGKYVDYLPDTLDGSVLYMSPPKYPGCTATPTKAGYGEDVNVDAWGLVPEQNAEVYIAQQMIGSADADEDGSIRVDVVLPRNLKEGKQLLTVRSKGTGLSADCVIEVQEKHTLDIFDVTFIVIKVAALLAVSLYLIKEGKKKFGSRKTA